MIEFAATTLGANPPGPNGGGLLLIIEWLSVYAVDTDINTPLVLNEVQITQPDGSIIPINLQNGTVIINACYPKDFDCDCDVDIIDVTMAAYAYGTLVGDPNYEAIYDLDDDGDIDIVDITMAAYDYGWFCGKSELNKFDYQTENDEN